MVRDLQPQAHLCYDAEALFHRRLEAQAELATQGAAREALCNAADEARTVEAEMARSVDTIVCVSADEAAALRALGARDPLVVEPWLSDLALTPAGFAERSDVFLVAGWLAGPESPNVDGLVWFVREVLPIVRARVPWVRVHVSGPGAAEGGSRCRGSWHLLRRPGEQHGRVLRPDACLHRAAQVRGRREDQDRRGAPVRCADGGDERRRRGH